MEKVLHIWIWASIAAMSVVIIKLIIELYKAITEDECKN